MPSRLSVAMQEVPAIPVHPGEILGERLAALGVSGAALSRAIDVPQSRVAEILAGRRAITADTALRLGLFFGTSARYWLNLQAAYDLAITARRDGERLAATVRPGPNGGD